MKKAEVFSLIAGTIGLVVDVIALSSFLRIDRHADPMDFEEAWPLWSILLLVYGWFLVSWFFTRVGWRRERRRRHHRTNFQTIAGISVLGVGLLMLPIAMMIIHPFIWNMEGAGNDAFEKTGGLVLMTMITLGFIGGAIFLAMGSLMTLIYDDVD